MTRHRVVLAAGLACAHVSFHAKDTAPPLWDEALHLLLAARFRDVLALPSPGNIEAWWAAWDFYPPFFHFWVGVLFRILGLSLLAPRLVNLALLGLLAVSTYRAARSLLGRDAAILATLLVSTFPLVTRMTRMAMTDLSVAALVAATVAWLLETRLLTRRQALLFGAVVGVGLLTKWIYPVFVIGPLAAWWLAPDGGTPPRPGLGRGLLAAAGAAIVAGPWYAPNLPTIVERGVLLAGLGPVQGNPHGWNVDNALVYARVVVEAFVSAPVALLVVGSFVAALGALTLKRNGADERRALVILLAWLVVPYVVMTAISNKDPRFVLPLAAPIAILCAWGVGALPPSLARAIRGLLIAHLVCAYVVAAAPPSVSKRLVGIVSHVPGFGAALVHDVALMQPPGDRGWPAAAVVDEVRRGLGPVAHRAALDVVPDFPTLNPNTLTWLARQEGFELVARHPTALGELDPVWSEYVLLKPRGSQGIAHTTGQSAAITDEALAWGEDLLPVATFPSPDGESLELTRTRASLPPASLRAGIIEPAAPGARWFLGSGWGGPEPGGRWGLGKEAFVRVQLEVLRAHRLRVTLQPYRLPQSVSVRYRDAAVAVWTLREAGESVLEAEIPSDLPTGAVDAIRFGFAWSTQPSAIGASADHRRLAVFVRRVEIEPR